jgi:hypothetical protein
MFFKELEGIRVKGKGCPKPIKTWAQCGVSKKELDVLKKQNYEKPTPIQAQAIPAIMSGKHAWIWVNVQRNTGILYEVEVLGKWFCRSLFVLMKN